MEEEDDPFLSDDFDATPLVPGCVDAIRALADERFGERIFLVTVARAQVRRRSALPGARGRSARLCQILAAGAAIDVITRGLFVRAPRPRAGRSRARGGRCLGRSRQRSRAG